jgi:uncharacterized phage infection (PIP) family protein YhgE
MVYQPRTRAPRNIGRREMPRHEKAKAKATGKKHRSRRSYISEEKHVLTSEEVVDRTLNSLRILGNQRFAPPPFYGNFGRWLANLGNVLSEFESSSTISVDGQFVKERSQTLSNVGLQLEERRQNEASRDEAIKSLSDNRILLERIEEEYTTRTKEIEGRKDREINRLSTNVNSLREELDRISRMKTGIFRAVSKKARAQKEAEATQRLNSAQKDLRLAVQHFTTEQELLRDEYERRKQLVIEQIQDLRKGIENQEFDHSLEDRRAACESLAHAVKALLQRKNRIIAEREKEDDL